MAEEIIIVGCGPSGSILARSIAEELDMKVKLVERRPHIAGNMYDETDSHGFLIQKYGPHHFYTSDYRIFRVFERFGDFFPHYCKSSNFIDGRYVPMPFNFHTLQALVGRERAAVLIPKLRSAYGSSRVPVIDLTENPDPDIAEYGRLLIDKSFRPYIAKMWDIPFDRIDRSVLGRRAMAMSYDERMADYDFQALPKDGFTKMIGRMLDHPNIEVELNTDALEHITMRDSEILYDGRRADCLVFTGPIDELFGFCYGPLPYRSLDIRWDYYDEDSVLPTEGAAYPQAEGYVRKTEYRKMMWDTSGLKGSVVSTEYPVAYKRGSTPGGEPYYPVLTRESQRIYGEYRKLASQYDRLFLCGRLAEFRYIDMHTCIEHALEVFEDVKRCLGAGTGERCVE